MCGIGLVLSDSGVLDQALWQELARRGPDIQTIVAVQLPERKCVLSLVGAVLHLRGKEGEPTAQPARDADDNLLLWNGEVFGGLDVPDGSSDTRAVLSALASGRAVIDVLNRIEGPFAFVYWQVRIIANDRLIAICVFCVIARAVQAKSQTLFYGRDKFGRRSLLLGFAPSSELHICLTAV